MKPENVPTELLRHPVADYLSADPFQGDDSEIAIRRIDIVRPKKIVSCSIGRTEQPVGSVMWCEQGVIDGQYQRNFCCLPHIAIAIEFAVKGDRDPYEFSCVEAKGYVPTKDEDDE